MVDLLSEEEQWESLKAWLRTNGLSVLALTAVLLLAWFGWKWWQDRGVQQAQRAGALYQQILDTFDAGNNDEALRQVETLRSEFPKSPYVNAADLVAANVLVENNELDNAAQRLQRVADEAVDEKLRPIARLRLARVQAAAGNYDTALATLGTADMGPHEAARLEIRGDVLYAKGDREGALKEYLAARDTLPAFERGEGTVGELLDLKIADLGGPPADAEESAGSAAADSSSEAAASAATASGAGAAAPPAEPVETP